MTRYELLLLTVPELTKDEAHTLETAFEKVLSEHQATIRSWDRWGKYQLAYPIRKNDYGVYFLLRFDIPAERAHALIDVLNTFCTVKYIDVIMRHMVTRLAPNAPLEYKRPESLEEAPAREMPTFMKENGSDGFMTRSDDRDEDSMEDNARA